MTGGLHVVSLACMVEWNTSQSSPCNPRCWPQKKDDHSMVNFQAYSAVCSLWHVEAE